MSIKGVMGVLVGGRLRVGWMNVEGRGSEKERKGRLMGGGAGAALGGVLGKDEERGLIGGVGGGLGGNG